MPPPCDCTVRPVSHSRSCLSSTDGCAVAELPSARLYHWAGCHRQVMLCRRCDHGNVYCFDGCAPEARRDSLRRVGARYRSTRRGRFNNAVRQRRFRAKSSIVTHQGSRPTGTPAVLPVTEKRPDRPQTLVRSAVDSLHCHHCGRPCDPFLRRDFLRSSARQRQILA
jgi:hypothetical protein